MSTLRTMPRSSPTPTDTGRPRSRQRDRDPDSRFLSASGSLRRGFRTVGIREGGAATSASDIDEYLRGIEEPERGTLEALRRTILEIVPDAEQGISYGMPAFKLRGKTIAGFAAFKNHLSYLPHSGSVIPKLAAETKRYTSTRGSLHFPVDKPLPKTLVRKLLSVRIEEAFGAR
jgi:uncharacterized protein YdhG (YjbR/CyaY superfamily)